MSLLDKDFVARETAAPLAEKLAVMCRMLGHHELIGMFGHVSLRIPETELMMISPGAGADKSAVAVDDLFLFRLDGEMLHHPGGTIPIEWRIHTQIHRDRPDAMCVAHLHAHHATLLGIARKALRPVFTHGAFLCDGAPTWDDARLVVEDGQAASLSRALGAADVVQMRGHGSVVVGRSAEEAFFSSLFLEQNARFQIEADAIGGAHELDPAIARDCADGTRNDRLYGLVWRYHELKSRAALQGRR
jgi:ribulose-5-phosphate 4-epimerase/fuculose-1-phosphate aldolase